MSYKYFHILSKKKEARLSTEPLCSFCKKETVISKRAFKAKFEQLPQTREEVVFKTYELSIFGVVLSTDMGTRVNINSSPHKPCNQHGKKKDHTF